MKSSIVFLFACLALGACTTQPARAPQSAPPGEGAAATAPRPAGPGMMGGGMMGPGMTPHGKGEGMMGHGMMAGGSMNECPMHLEGVTVKTNDVEGGAELIFTTTGDVAELRRRVARMAEMHAQHAGKDCPMMSTHGAAPAAPTPSPAP